MDTQLWNRAQALFDEALARPAEVRDAFLDEACAGHPGLRREVDSLLQADTQAGDFLESVMQGGLEIFAARSTPKPTHGRFGKYRVSSPIGEGGFGQVFAGFDPILHRPVAIKTCTSLEPGLGETFLREARIAAGLQHPNIVTIYDFGSEDDVPYMVQELLTGRDLAKVIRDEAHLGLRQQVDYLRQIARGLAYAHSQGVLHRDVKPANVRVLDNGQLKILDFGIAKLMETDREDSARGQLVGTLGYLAPERIAGEPAGVRSEIYSFGALAYEVLVVQKMKPDSSATVLAEALEDADAWSQERPEEKVPKALRALVARCLARDPAGRYDSFQEIHEELESLKAELGRQPPEVVRRRWLAAAGVAGIAAGLALLASAWPLPAPDYEAPSVERPASPRSLEARPEAFSVAAREPGPALLPDDEGPLQSRATPTTAEPRDFAEGTVASSRPAGAIEPPPGTFEGLGSSEPPTATLPAAEGNASSSGSEEVTALEAPADGQESDPEPPAETQEEGAAEEGEPAEGRDDSDEEARDRPRLLSRPEPAYPRAALRRRQEAVVVVAVLVTAQGEVGNAVVTQSSDPGLGFDEAALAAAEMARFQPAEKEGQPIDAWAELSFEFRLP